MGKYLAFLFGASLLALGFPSVFADYQKRIAAEGSVERLADPAPVVEAALPAAAARPGTATLPAGPDGHFRTKARINGRPVDVLVDTGATYVAMNEGTARGLGLVVPAADFRFESATANGRVKTALAMLDRVAIGNVEVRNVAVAVTQGKGLDTVLLGMSFMNKLRRYDVADGRLNLVR